ncbi:hypothetical protein RYX36_006495, partial [Vicia faba]
VLHMFQRMFLKRIRRKSVRATWLKPIVCLLTIATTSAMKLDNFLVGGTIPDYILQLPNEVMSSPMGALMLPMIQNLETTLKAGGVPQMPQFRPSTVTSASNFSSVNTQKSSTGLNSSTENKVINKEVKGKEEVKKTENAVSFYI